MAGAVDAPVNGSALPGFVAPYRLVDNVKPPAAAHDAVIAVTRAKRLERIFDLHSQNLQGHRAPLEPQEARAVS
jgi:hypothetical protein